MIEIVQKWIDVLKRLKYVKKKKIVLSIRIPQEIFTKLLVIFFFY